MKSQAIGNSENVLCDTKGTETHGLVSLQLTAVQGIYGCVTASNSKWIYLQWDLKHYWDHQLSTRKNNTQFLTRSILSVHWKSSSTVRSFNPIHVLSWLRPEKKVTGNEYKINTYSTHNNTHSTSIWWVLSALFLSIHQLFHLSQVFFSVNKTCG